MKDGLSTIYSVIGENAAPGSDGRHNKTLKLVVKSRRGIFAELL